jgi:hypothetical protein
MALWIYLNELAKHFEKPSAVTFFRSEEARKDGSRARRLVEAGQGWSE